MLIKKSGIYFVAAVAASVAGGSVALANSSVSGESADKTWNSILGEKHRQSDMRGLLQNVQQQTVQLKFENRYQQPVDYYLVNPVTNEPKFLDTIGPGQSTIVQSTPGMRWIFGVNQSQIQSYDTQDAPLQQVIVAPQGQQQQGQQGQQTQQGQPNNPGRSQPGAPQNTQQGAFPGTGAQPFGQNQQAAGNGVRMPPVPNSTQQPAQQQPRPAQQQPWQQQPQTQQPQQGFVPAGNPPWGQQQPARPQQPTNTPTQGQPQNGQFGQPQSGIPRLQQQNALRQPPGLYEIGTTLDTCRKARFAAGAPQIEICRYLGQLNPVAYQNYLAQIQVLQQTRDRFVGQQGGSNSGNPVGFGDVASWGGVVRSGPGMETNRVDSLQRGEAIEILQDSGVFMNGYNWFQIRYRGNQIGYQWGGIMCGRSQPVPGVHEVCN